MSQTQKITAEIKESALRHFEQILKRASEKRASDIHLKAGLPPIVRVNGNLYYLADEAKGHQRISNEQLNNFALSLMNPRQLEKYDLGQEVDLGYEVSAGIRFRINVCQQRSNPRFVCRHIPEVIKTMEDLGLPSAVEELCVQQRGLILVTGSTGSGKSTTLASMIDHIARNRSCHILTIEDPIEFVFKDRRSIVTQREVGLDTESFSRALKFALRQDPDVILVGEMRDEETIMMALAAAETGHLVLSTLHTLDAVETVNRVLGNVNGNVQDSVRGQLAGTLVGVVSQRLVKRMDGKSRVPAVEVMLNNVRVREMILDPTRTAGLHNVIEESNSSGMQSFDQSLMSLYTNKVISKEEALLNCSNVRDFQLRLEGVVGGEWRDATNITETNRRQQVKDAMTQEPGSGEIELDFADVRKRKK